jgi:VWFA-related protein
MRLVNQKIVALFILSLLGAAHTAASQATPEQAPPAAPTTTLRTEVRLVVVDAMVVDKNGVSVKGLKADDFVLKEDKVPQKIASVDDHTATAETSTVVRPIISEAGTTVLTNKPVNSPTVWNVLLVDLLNTDIASQAIMRKQVQQFVKSLPPGQPLALVAMRAELKLLVPFHGGAGAIDKILTTSALSPAPSPLLDIYNSDDEALLAKMISNPTMLNSAVSNRDSIEVEKLGQRVQTTLESFGGLAKWLGKYQGRKNVYWLSSGFPLQVEPSGSMGGDNPTNRSNLAGELLLMQKAMDKQLESSRVAIYPIDVRGVIGAETPGVDSSDTSGGMYVYDPPGLASQEGKYDRVTASEQAEMLDIAHSTGGIARFNHNDVVGILHEDFNQSQNYYTISYSPSNTKWDGNYRRIDIALQQKGYRLVYRRGYFARDLHPEPMPTVDQFTLAMKHGAAPETSVLFSAKLHKSADKVEVEYAIDPQTLQFRPEPSGKELAEVACVIVEYDSAGKVIGTSQIQVTGRVNPEQRANLQTNAFPAKQTVPLKPGAATLTIGVRDQSTGRFGNLEVAIAAPTPN